MKYYSIYLVLDSICIDHFVLVVYYKLAPIERNIERNERTGTGQYGRIPDNAGTG